MRSRFLVFAGVVCAVLVAALGPAPAGEGAPTRGVVVAPGVYRTLARGGRARVVVSLRSRVVGRSLASTRAVVSGLQRRVLGRVGLGFTLVRRYRAVPALAGRVDRASLQRLKSSPEVAAVALDHRVHADLEQSVPLIGADTVHQQGFTGAGATVAILDTGIDTNHPDLADSIAAQGCFVVHDNGTGGCPGGTKRSIGPGAAEDDEGHGTSVAGIITGNGSATHPAGVAPGARIVAAKVLGQDGSGFDSNILAGLDWIIDDNPDVDIVNLSLGSDSLFSSACDTTDGLADASALDALRSRGVLTFAASGNDGTSGFIAEPACIAGVVSVGAVYDAAVGQADWSDCSDPTTAPDMVTCFSDAAPTLDLLAPGAVITDVPTRNGGYDEFDGTSAATPHAAGVAALLLQAHPNLTPDQLETVMVQTGKAVLDPRNNLTFRRVDAAAALDALKLVSPGPGPSFLPDADATYAEQGGDASSGPDLGDVSVSSARGILNFTVRTPNRASLPPGEWLELRIDADRNTATGNPSGFDAVIRLDDQGAILDRWIGGTFVAVRPLSDLASGSGQLVVRVSQEELGIADGFEFQAVSPSDVAPASGMWSYPAFAVTVTRTGTGTGRVSGGPIDCGAVCATFAGRGELMTLAASPGADSVFAGWGPPCSGTGTCTVLVDGPKQVEARFELLRRLAVSLGGLGKGAVTSSPDGIDCGARCDAKFTNGTRVTLTPRAKAGSRFARWTGACSGSGACTVDLLAAASVKALFVDVARPTARALAASARRGTRARLRFRLTDNSGRARATVTVEGRARKLVTLRRRLGPAVGVTTLLWRIPSSLTPGLLRFCVRPSDGSGHAGKRSCAPLRVR